MINEIDRNNKNDLNGITKDQKQSLGFESDRNLQASDIEREQMEVRQRVFNQSPEYKKREIVFAQIQKINNRLSNLEEKVDEILSILKATD
ncbi:hypothetical protein [Candidatus Nitrosocosmicus franklandus]|uniref:Uncharacterized protein n=1 Tax=Candidatus Nitrosocosmicus franklandianus TaxID=1798806 RepID=A0A484IEU6_9ARCH|nr:hypothetical protein [Candidatus Nitrosocosmicus franklandus]VFJ14531.1 conserved protein of unknown function [Candidatus Nitrosocosmicus franklandus]